MLNASELVTKCPSKYENATNALTVSQLTGYGDEVVDKPVKVAGAVKDGTLKAAGYEKPNIALLSMVEQVSFHMKDTVEAQELVKEHKSKPIADCNLVGPIAYDLILSKEAARLKGYDNPLCGDFDGIIVPSLLAGNLIVKCWQMHAQAQTCGVVIGAKVPVALTSRSDAKEVAFHSLAFCAALGGRF